MIARGNNRWEPSEYENHRELFRSRMLTIGRTGPSSFGPLDGDISPPKRLPLSREIVITPDFPEREVRTFSSVCLIMWNFLSEKRADLFDRIYTV